MIYTDYWNLQKSLEQDTPYFPPCEFSELYTLLLLRVTLINFPILYATQPSNVNSVELESNLSSDHDGPADLEGEVRATNVSVGHSDPAPVHFVHHQDKLQILNVAEPGNVSSTCLSIEDLIGLTCIHKLPADTTAEVFEFHNSPPDDLSTDCGIRTTELVDRADHVDRSCKIGREYGRTSASYDGMPEY